VSAFGQKLSQQGLDLTPDIAAEPEPRFGCENRVRKVTSTIGILSSEVNILMNVPAFVNLTVWVFGCTVKSLSWILRIADTEVRLADRADSAISRPHRGLGPHIGCTRCSGSPTVARFFQPG
jgi:hypothetical protein